MPAIVGSTDSRSEQRCHHFEDLSDLGDRAAGPTDRSKTPRGLQARGVDRVRCADRASAFVRQPPAGVVASNPAGSDAKLFATAAAPPIGTFEWSLQAAGLYLP